MCSFDYDPAQVYRQSMRTAARRHRCAECGRVIEPGEMYEHAVGLQDGEWWGFKTCRHCLSAREWLRIVCRSWMHGMLADELHEHIEEYPWVTPRWLHTAVACIRRRWTRDDGRLMNPMGKPPIPADMVGIG